MVKAIKADSVDKLMIPLSASLGALCWWTQSLHGGSGLLLRTDGSRRAGLLGHEALPCFGPGDGGVGDGAAELHSDVGQDGGRVGARRDLGKSRRLPLCGGAAWGRRRRGGRSGAAGRGGAGGGGRRGDGDRTSRGASSRRVH